MKTLPLQIKLHSLNLSPLTITLWSWHLL